jgi:hypothetical protein
VFGALAQGLETGEVKTREIRVRNPDGSESIRIVPDMPGQEFVSAPEATETEAERLRRIETESAARARGTAAGTPDAGPVPEDVQRDIQSLPSRWQDFDARHVTRDDFSVRGGQKAGAIAYANAQGKVLPTKKQAEAIIAAKSTVRDIEQAQQLLADPEVKFWLGRYAGSITNFLSAGWAGDREVPAKVRQFRANLNRLAAEERHRLYGAALTKVESRFASGFLPAITQPPSQIGSSLQEFVDDISRGMGALWGGSEDGGVGTATHVWTPQGIRPKEVE